MISNGLAALALCAALALAGCGGDDPEPPAGGEAGGNVEGAGTSRPPEETPEPTPVPTAPADPEEPLASREGTIASWPVLLEIVELRRSDATVALTFRLTTEQETGVGAQVSDTFSDGVAEEVPEGVEGDVTTGSRLTSSLDGISLIDGVNRKRYLVARDSRGVCVCDVNLSTVFVTPDAPVTLSATFGAPPPEVEAVDVQIPSFGTFADVPLA